MSDLYKTQRHMRQMRKDALSRGVVAVLDLGTSKIACLILRFEGQERFTGADGVGSMAGQSSFRVIGAATTKSRGMRFGDSVALAETVKAIRTAVQGAQKMAGVRVDHVIACTSGGAPRSYGLAGEMTLADEHVTEQDIARVLASCDMPPIGEGREVLHAQPVNFALDGRSGLPDPRGQMGKNLACDMHLLSVDERMIANLLWCAKRADLELAGVAHSAYTSGISALTEDQARTGAACIDMGGGTTSVSIFIKKHMIFAETVRLGGDHVTSDIAKGLGIPLQLAERIKTRHGGVVATGMDDREMIELKLGEEDWETRQISRAELIGIMRPRVEEILEEVRAVLDAAGFSHMPSQQIALTGGASQVPGLDHIAPQFLGQQATYGRPLRVQGLPQAATGPAFSGAVGLALFAAHPQDEWWDFEIPSDAYPARSLKRAVKWFRENW